MTTVPEAPLTLRLKRREARRITSGHPWVFANEVAAIQPADQSAGLCRIFDDSNRFIGTGFYNKHSLICARLFTRDPAEAIDGEFFRRRFVAARERRSTLYPPDEAFRWIYGEADGLPGLVADCYPGVVVVQVTTLALEQLRPLWEPELRSLAAPASLVIRNDAMSRQREGLPLFVGCTDEWPPARIPFTEAQAPCVALPCQGPNTGFYLDQRENRIWVRRLAQGASVLDLYSYTGAWGFSCLHAGAGKVTFVDRSRTALDAAEEVARNAEIVTRTVFTQEDAGAYLRSARQRKEHFDLVVADPPALIPARKDFGPGRRAYVTLYQSVLQTVAPGGYAVLCSRSYHLQDNTFEELVQQAATRSRRSVQIIWRGGAGPDHPRPAAMPEAHYLKCAFLAVS